MRESTKPRSRGPRVGATLSSAPLIGYSPARDIDCILHRPAATVAAEIRQRLQDGDKDRALRALIQLNDSLVAERGLVRGVLGLAEPETTKDPVWDAAIAAVVAWRLRDEELPTPDWVDARSRFVHDRQGLGVDAADPIPPDSEVPEEFAKRGVLVWRDTFVSV